MSESPGIEARPPIRTFRDLLIWQKAIALAKRIYGITRSFSPDERFGLTSQVRRAACSVSSNIAEGHVRSSREFLHFLLIARGSLAETESQLELAAELGYLNRTDISDIMTMAGELHRMIASLQSKIST